LGTSVQQILQVNMVGALKHTNNNNNNKFYLCCHLGDHPQGDLAMFGYRVAMKV
jgi:hypothetical protein